MPYGGLRGIVTAINRFAREPVMLGVTVLPYVPYSGEQFPLKRGQSHAVTYTWDGRTTQAHGPAYAGDYHAVAQWMYPYADTEQITFSLDGPSAP